MRHGALRDAIRVSVSRDSLLKHHMGRATRRPAASPTPAMMGRDDDEIQPVNAAGDRLEESAAFPLPGTRAFLSAAVVLPLQPDEMLQEALDRSSSFCGELMGCGIVDRSCRSHDLVRAAQEETSLAEERLCLLGRLRRRGGEAQVGGRVVCHVDSFALCGGPRH
jgi:hypothetical protein